MDNVTKYIGSGHGDCDIGCILTFKLRGRKAVGTKAFTDVARAANIVAKVNFIGVLIRRNEGGDCPGNKFALCYYEVISVLRGAALGELLRLHHTNTQYLQKTIPHQVSRQRFTFTRVVHSAASVSAASTRKTEGDGG